MCAAMFCNLACGMDIFEEMEEDGDEYAGGALEGPLPPLPVILRKVPPKLLSGNE